MLRIQLRANTEAEARMARAKLIRALQEVSEEGLAPAVKLKQETTDLFTAEVTYS